MSASASPDSVLRLHVASGRHVSAPVVHVDDVERAVEVGVTDLAVAPGERRVRCTGSWAGEQRSVEIAVTVPDGGVAQLWYVAPSHRALDGVLATAPHRDRTMAPIFIAVGAILLLVLLVGVLPVLAALS